MSNLSRNLQKFRDKVKPRRLPARVGWQDGTVYDSTTPNYIRLHWPDGVQFLAWNDGAPGSFGAHVDVIEDPDAPGLLKALSPRQVYTSQDYAYSIIKPHRLTHQWPNSDWAPVEMRQLMPLRPSVSGFTLSLRAGWVKTATGLVYYPGGSFSLLTNKPTVDGRFIRVCFTDLGAPTIIEGDIVSMFVLSVTDIPELPLGYTPNCVIRLYAGQSFVNDTGTGTTDLIDDRLTSFGGDGATAEWGGIGGTIEDQTDLVNYLFSYYKFNAVFFENNAVSFNNESVYYRSYEP